MYWNYLLFQPVCLKKERQTVKFGPNFTFERAEQDKVELERSSVNYVLTGVVHTHMVVLCIKGLWCWWWWWWWWFWLRLNYVKAFPDLSNDPTDNDVILTHVKKNIPRAMKIRPKLPSLQDQMYMSPATYHTVISSKYVMFCSHHMFMSWLSNPETSRVEFQHLYDSTWFFSGDPGQFSAVLVSDIFRGKSGHLQPCLWRVELVF